MNAIVSSTSQRREADLSLAVLIAGAAASLIPLPKVIPFGSGFEMCALAENLVFHGVFGNPNAVSATGPSAANPPLYPFILAGFIRLLDSHWLVAYAAMVLNAIANALTASLLLRVSKLFFDDIRPGIVAAVFWIASVQLMPAWDVGLTVTLLLVFILFTGKTIGDAKYPVHGTIAGLLAGALFLLNPSTLLVFAPWILNLLAFHRVPPRQSLRYAFLLAAVLVVIAGGWMLRNKAQLGAFVVRTNLGMTLYASNNDCARPSLRQEIADNCYQPHHPNTSLSEALLVRSMGEVAHDRMRRADAMDWIRAHPGAFLRLSLSRFGNFWCPPADGHLFKSGCIWLATLLSIPGLVLLGMRRKPILVFFLGVLFLYPLMYYAVVSDVRYRYPVLWISLLMAGYVLRRLVPFKSNSVEPEGPPA